MSEGAVAPLQRMLIGQTLERVLRLCWEGRKTFVAIAIVPPAIFFVTLGITFGGLMIPFFARMPKNMSASQNSEMGVLFLTCMGVVMLVCSAAFAPSLAAGCYASVHADLGRRVTFRESYVFAAQRYWRYLALFIVMILIGMSPVLVFEALALVPGLFLRHHSGELTPSLAALIPAGVFVFIGVYVMSILLMLRISLAFPACVTETLTVHAALRRSNLLTRGAKGRIFLVLLVVYAVCYTAYLVGFVVTAVWFGLLSASSLAMKGHISMTLTLIVGVATALGVVCMMMFFMACTGAGFSTALAVLYNDQRRVIDLPSPDIDSAGAPA